VTPQQTFSAEAEAAADRYALLVEAWRSLYSGALDRNDFGSQRQMDDVTAQAYAIGHTFLEGEGAHIGTISERIALGALQSALDDLTSNDSAELTEAASEHLSDAESYVERELAIQVERDIAFLRQSLRRAYLQVSLAATAQGIPTRAALIQYRIGNASELHFFFHDRGNQKWPSRKFVRALWRHHLVTLWNEITLLTLADHGLGEAIVDHASPASHSHGMIVSMSAGSAHPTYSEIRNEIFHPNSDAILKARL
jgi:hypothetical protein